MGDDVGAEAEGCDRGDKRLNARCRLVPGRRGDRPQSGIPAACRGQAEAEAAYRFFGHPNIAPANLLAPHHAATRRRMAGRTCVVVARDTAEIDPTRRGRVVGGPLADDRRCGFSSHLPPAITPSGVPPGVSAAPRTRSRDPRAGDRPERRKRPPIAAEEGRRRVEGHRACREAARALPGVEGIGVSDGGGDPDEAPAEARTQRHAAKVVVRACRDRRPIGDGRRSTGSWRGGCSRRRCWVGRPRTCRAGRFRRRRSGRRCMSWRCGRRCRRSRRNGG